MGDWGDSDEVYAITAVVSIEPNGDNTVRTVKHPVDRLEYGDVDTPVGAGVILILDRLSGLITDGINWLLGTGDDQVDIARTAVFDIDAMEEFGRQGVKRYIGHLDFLGLDHDYTPDLKAHFFSVHSGGGGKYVFGFEFVRDPAFVVDEIEVA